MLDRSTPQMTPFRVHFTDRSTMGISAASAAEARQQAERAAAQRGTYVAKVKVIREHSHGQ
ncbi:hypothetical protein [Pannonibacter sp. P2PFMT1]|uniref:hypothetical protein n=1 Tax=Pannonibacter sp. P2PFMT1 TaxID=2003582 RepID=UPI00164899C8|nr:hypothetical protein [Pannonibacter sp. P2PFMT1]